MNKLKIVFITLITTLLSVAQAMADEIPDANIEGNWNTLLTDQCNGGRYYFYAIEENGVIKLGHTTVAPKSDAEATGDNARYHYSNYCFQIEGNETDGYTFRCLKYEEDEDGPKYITNPQTIQDAYQDVRLTTTPSHYFFTANRQLQLMDETTKQPINHYLAFYSKNWHTVRLHYSPDYSGSRLTIGGIYGYNVSAKIKDTETAVPGGGVTYNNVKYRNGETLHASAAHADFTNITVEGYTFVSKNVNPPTQENPNGTIVVTYTPIHTTGFEYIHVTKPVSGNNIYNGQGNENAETKKIALLDPKDYITNKDENLQPKYDKVPAGKAWQMIIEVENSGTNSFNEWGSCILSSSADPLNTFYWGDFQVYQHKYTTERPATLNFKSNKGDGNDHVIAQKQSVQDKNYKVTVRYDGGNVYVIRTTIDEKNYDNVWYAARIQQDITQMSCALPEGINLKSLSISIAEEHGLFEDVDYAIQNMGNGDYLSWDLETETMQCYHHANHASKFRVVFTNDNNLAYHDQDGALHSTIFIKPEVWNEEKKVVEYKFIGNNGSLVDEQANAMPFLYSPDTKQICQVINKGTGEGATSELGAAWTLSNYTGACSGGNDKWIFDFFASYQVVVSPSELQGEGKGGISYKTLPFYHDGFIELPGNVDSGHWNSISIPGYFASVTKEATMVKVKYTSLDNTFYHITTLDDHNNPTATSPIYYWYKDRQDTPSLITYSTTNSQSGQATEWDDKGDCSKYTITKAIQIPMNMSKVGDKYYNTVYCPNALTLPNGVKAYRLNEVTDNKFKLKEIELTDNVLPAKTPAVLISDNAVSDTEWPISTTSSAAISDNNLFSGVFEDTANPGIAQPSTCTVYVLGSKGKDEQNNEVTGIGFYKYTGTNIPAFKAYHQINGIGAKTSFTFAFDDDVTGITEKESAESENGMYYDLSGRAVSVPLHGHLYIHNGKKVIY